MQRPSQTTLHFLGAVVLQADENPAGTLQPRSIIDGQQRLTTLQLLLDAAGGVFEEAEFGNFAAQMEGLTQNPAHFVRAEDTLKLRHLNRDGGAFAEVMQADPPVDYDGLKHGGSLFARAHQYFSEQVSAWVREGSPDPYPANNGGSEAAQMPTVSEQQVAARAAALAWVLTHGLQLVVTDLRREENSQAIFETLNARGTPLTAADLIKNLVFQRLAAEGADTQEAYHALWPFDASFWRRRSRLAGTPCRAARCSLTSGWCHESVKRSAPARLLPGSSTTSSTKPGPTCRTY